MFKVDNIHCVPYYSAPTCRQETNAHYIVTIRKVSNVPAGLMITMQAQTYSTVLSAAVVTQALTVSAIPILKCKGNAC